MKNISKQLDELESYIPRFEEENPKVSKSTIGWQIDHTLKVVNGVIQTLQHAPTDKKPKITAVGRICLTTRHIPRGRGKAPQAVMPPETIIKDALIKQLQTAKALLPKIDTIHPKATFKHPFFGILTKSQTLKFLEVHTKHHLKIMRDILK